MTNYERIAEKMYSAYCQQAGGLTFDGKPLPSWQELGLERQSCWRAAADASKMVAPPNLKQLADSFPELNPSNYDAEDVDKLHNWALEVVQAITTIDQEAESVVPPEPFGYFKCDAYGWMDCAETDEDARPLYEAPQPQADATTPQGLRECCEHLNAAGHAIPSACPHIIWYDDRDRAPEIFAGEGAKEAAERRFEQISDSWNAHLFVSIAANSRDCPHPVATVADPHPQAQADTRDAGLLNFLQDQSIDLRCFNSSDGEDVGWRTVQHHMSEPRERVVSEVYGDQPRLAIREAMARSSAERNTMTPTQHCQSCRHLGKSEEHGYCALFILAPKRFCEHNTCGPVARTAARLNYVIDRYPNEVLQKGKS